MMSPLKCAHNNNMVKVVIWIERVYEYDDDKQRHMHTFDPAHTSSAPQPLLFTYARIRFVCRCSGLGAGLM